MNLVRVSIDHGVGCTIVKLVPEYEVPVLRAIHGDINVAVGESQKSDKPFDADRAFDGLVNKYRQKGSDGDPVRTIYRDAAALDRAVSKAPEKKAAKPESEKKAAKPESEKKAAKPESEKKAAKPE